MNQLDQDDTCLHEERKCFQFPKELHGLEVNEMVIIEWDGSVRSREEVVLETAYIYERAGYDTVLVDEEGLDFRPSEDVKDDPLIRVRLPTDEERMALRLGVLETHVT